MAGFHYHYKKGHKALYTLATIILIILAAGIFYLDVSSDLSRNSTNLSKTNVSNAANTSGQEQPGGSLSGTTLPDTTQPPPAEAPENQTAGNATNQTSNQTVNETDNFLVNNQTLNAQQVPVQTGAGLKAEYFPGLVINGTPAGTGTVPSIDMNWNDTNRPAGVDWHRFSARLSGFLSIDATGDYVFILTSDDGSRMFLDGQLVTDLWDSSGVNSRSALRNAAAGLHNITIEYKNIGGGVAKVRLEYFASDLNITRQVIPADKFSN
jgi:hypothetical protein